MSLSSKNSLAKIFYLDQDNAWQEYTIATLAFTHIDDQAYLMVLNDQSSDIPPKINLTFSTAHHPQTANLPIIG